MLVHGDSTVLTHPESITLHTNITFGTATLRDLNVETFSVLDIILRVKVFTSFGIKL